MSKCVLPKNGAAIKIEQYCKRRKDRMKPKRQEDSSCVFAYYFCRGTCHRRDTAEKKKAPKLHRHRSEKRSFEKSRWDDTAGKSSRERQAPAPCMPQSECGAGHTGYRASPIRRRADHRTPAEPSAAEFSGMVSAVAHTSRGQRPPYRSVLTWHK